MITTIIEIIRVLKTDMIYVGSKIWLIPDGPLDGCIEGLDVGWIDGCEEGIAVEGWT
jgi:hypothetical protein